MKQQYKIVKNPKPLSPEQMDKHKDFGALLQNYQKVHQYGSITRPFYRNYGLLSLMVLIGVVILVILLDKPENTPGAKPQEQTTAPLANDSVTTMSDSASSASDKGVDNTSHVEVKSVKDPSGEWHYIVEFDADKKFYYELPNGTRFLIAANSLLDKAGNVASGKMEWLFRQTAAQRTKLKASDTLSASTEFEFRIREKKTKAWVELKSPAVFEVPLVLKGLLKGWHWSRVKERWQAEPLQTKIRFVLQTDQKEYQVLAHHAWELSFNGENERAELQRNFIKEWRSLEGRNEAIKLKSDRAFTVFPMKLARVEADRELQRAKESEIWECWLKKMTDTCSGNTIKQWGTSNLMFRQHVTSVCLETTNTGIFLLSYEKGSFGTNNRVLQLKTPPPDSRVVPTENYNP